MKRMFLVGFFFTLFCLGDYVTAQQAEQSEAPVYQDGQSWQFKIDSSNYTHTGYSSDFVADGIYELSFSNGAFKVFQVNGAEKTEIADRLGMLYGTIGQGKWHGGQFLKDLLHI